MPLKREIADGGFVHALEVKLKGFPKAFFFTIGDAGEANRLRHRTQNDTGGFLYFWNEADGLYSASLGLRAVAINHKFIPYVRFLLDPSPLTRADKAQPVELPDVRLWFEGEAEPRGFESDSEPRQDDDEDYGDLEAICQNLDTYDGDPDGVALEFTDVDGEHVVIRLDNLVMIDIDATLVDRKACEEWHKTMAAAEAAGEVDF